MPFICNCEVEFTSKKSLTNHLRSCKYTKKDYDEIYNLYKKGITFKDLKNMGYTNAAIYYALKDRKRNIKDAIVLARKIHVESYVQTEETKKSISLGVKKAHKEGRMWNIGMSRWNNKPSKPEEIFMKFLNNIGFEKDVDYYYEFPFSIYSADFYFPNISLVIEIDGKQHEQKEYMERDKKKDKIINDQGIKVFRITVKKLYSDSKNVFKSIEKMLTQEIYRGVEQSGSLLGS